MKLQWLIGSFICIAWATTGCSSQPPAKDANAPVVSLASPPSAKEPVADKAQPEDPKPLEKPEQPPAENGVGNVFGNSMGDASALGGIGVMGGIPGQDPLVGGVSSGSTGPTYVGNSIDKEAIRRVIRAHINEVKQCYETALKRDPDLEGRVVLKFTIAKNGDVTAATIQDSTLKDPAVGQCIAAGALKWKFPEHPGPGVIYINYPFVFKSA